MNSKHPHIQRFLGILQLIVFTVFFMAGVNYIQAAFTAPTSSPPPSGTTVVSLNTSPIFQDKPAPLEANGVGVDNGFVLNGVSRTTAEGWPTDLNQTADCRLEVRRVLSNQRRFFQDTGGAAGSYAQWHYPKCGDYLTPEAIAAGWIPSGGDNCNAIYGDVCQFPSECIYTRLNCFSGITVVGSLMTTSTYQGTPISVPTISTTTIPL